MALKPKQLAQQVAVCVKARRAPMVHGDPGIGKSEIMRQVADTLFAERYGYTVEDGVLMQEVGTPKGKGAKAKVPVPANFQRPWFRDVRAALLDAVDLRGLPTVQDGKSTWAVPEFLPTDDRGGIFFLDEINRGTEMVANACFSLVLSGELGEYRLPANWVAAAAVNDKDTGARKMSSALQARFIHLDAVTDLNAVCDLALARNWHPAVIAFLRFRPDLLHMYDPKERVSPNPRAWEFVSDLVGVDEHVSHDLIAGTIGQGAAVEFVAFLALYRNLPNLDQIITDPTHADVPTKPDVLYAVSAALARRATEKNFGRILQYVERMASEYAVLTVTSAARANRDLASTPEYTRFMVKNAKLFGATA